MSNLGSRLPKTNRAFYSIIGYKGEMKPVMVGVNRPCSDIFLVYRMLHAPNHIDCKVSLF